MPSPERITASLSIVITGASACGKTTLYHHLLDLTNLIASPPHMTRAPREGEKPGIDAIFVTEEQFKLNFSNGKYIEDSLDFAKFNNNYYGSPVDWIYRVLKGDQLCFVSPSTGIARHVKTQVKDKILWVHLTATDEVRRKRIKEREPNITDEELHRRLTGGDSQETPEDCDLMIDTSTLTAEQIYELVLERLKKAH